MIDAQRRAVLALLAATAWGCGEGHQETAGPGSQGSENVVQTLSYHADVRALVETKCARCHQKGNIAPFPLTTYDEVFALRAAIAASVSSGSMPPWQPAKDCAEYAADFSLDESERSRLLDWIAQGGVEGDASDYVAPAQAATQFKADLEVALPEPYTPQGKPDDYRCFLIDWPKTSSTFVTGFRMVPDRIDLVHHVIAYVASPAQVATFRAMDEAEPGPGYTCFGGPNAEDAQATGRPFQIGGWVPGAAGGNFPTDTGIEIDPGSVLIVQFHYNSLSAKPGPDQSRLQISLAEQVAKPAMTFLALDPRWLRASGMTIPAGEAKVVHESTVDVTALFGALGGARIGLGQGDPFVIHNVGLHMHELGRSGRASIVREGGAEQCLIHIADWDFSWQGTYRLKDPVQVNSGDRLRISCEWDNSPGNQTFVDGVQRKSQDVEWGEGTGDEMCLAPLFVTAR